LIDLEKNKPVSLKLTQSGVNDYNSCHKKWYWAHECSYRPAQKKEGALRTGQLFHRMLELFYLGYPNQAKAIIDATYPDRFEDGAQKRLWALTLSMCNHYIKSFTLPPYIGIELKVKRELTIDTTIYGTIDYVSKESLFDHKTASVIDDETLEMFRYKPQAHIYMWLLGAYGIHIDRFQFNVIKK
jgi:hypothetical protein